MDNATKALKMAAGILIAIVLVTLLVLVFTRVSRIRKGEQTEEEASQLAAFNSYYTKYLNKYVYGTEVITIINRGIREGVTVNTGRAIPGAGIGKADTAEVNYYSQRRFQCTAIGYNASGKVNAITFAERT